MGSLISPTTVQCVQVSKNDEEEHCSLKQFGSRYTLIAEPFFEMAFINHHSIYGISLEIYKDIPICH
jgi:hypothetical protein